MAAVRQKGRDLMLYSGVSWGATGYEVEVLDHEGNHAAAPARFSVSETDAMIVYLRDLGGKAAHVVDSTNGLLDGRMMAAGLAVYRADPHVLPERPLFGSVEAADLARAAQRDLSALTLLERDRGTQTGREDDLEAGIAASTLAIDALTGAGRCLGAGTRDRLEVALTFDDGPNPPYTGQIMDVLEQYGIPATFFCIGLNAGGQAEEISRMRDQGHGLGNHTWSHPFLPELSRKQLEEQITRTGDTIAQAGGGAAPTLFRPPYGSRTPDVTRWLGDLDSTIVLWDVDPSDWSMPGAGVIARTVLEQTRPGSIILLHDGGGDRSQTVAALPMIIEGLLARGYSFALVDDLVTPTGRTVRAGNRI
ncbi:polysaccharide deacetylase family protein [Streptomyces sp. NBC_01520]|uniref:polysaccharide deacetylase family protein n=1 Tax=Streptomyces sp. NBC_01520 TaxID=2903892 RepID=UPI0038690B6E